MPEYAVPGLPDICWPVDTSCIEDYDAWQVEPDPDNDVVGVPVYTAAQKARSLALAAQTLRMLTGYRVGGCPVTVRPAAPWCRERTWRSMPTPGTGAGPYSPISVGGRWLNIGGCSHGGSCGCHRIAEVRLPSSVTRILEVKIDGMVLDPTAYRLDRGGYLVRMDGDWWPRCQNLAAPDTMLGTWSITYQSGIEVDGVAAAAAGILAQEFLTACTGGNCRLPSNVTQIARSGVTLTLAEGAFPNGRTGVLEVDAFIERYNPNGLKSPPVVYSPDMHRPRAESRRGSYVPPLDEIDGGSP